MNNTIKALLLLLFLGVCIITTHAQTVLQQKTHLAREGDVTLKQELQYKSPGRNGYLFQIQDIKTLSPVLLILY